MNVIAKHQSYFFFIHGIQEATTVEVRGREPVTVVTEVDVEDYPRSGPNGRHNPEGPHP